MMELHQNLTHLHLGGQTLPENMMALAPLVWIGITVIVSLLFGIFANVHCKCLHELQEPFDNAVTWAKDQAMKVFGPVGQCLGHVKERATKICCKSSAEEPNAQNEAHELEAMTNNDDSNA